MTEIYLRRSRRPRGCLRAVVILAGAVLLVVAALLAFTIKKRAAARPRPARIPVLETNRPTAITAVPVEPPDPGPELLSQARRLEENNDLLGARAKCFRILEVSSNANVRAAAEILLGRVNTQLVFSPMPMPEKVEYTVKRGDSMAKLAKKFNTTVELIKRSNNIKGSLIRVGDRFRILKGKFSVKVDRNENTLALYLDGRFFKKYRVGTGKYQRTPTGNFKITERIPNPTWWRPDGRAVPYGDTNNVLGTYWLSLNIPGYGIHGTWDPETVGKHSSQGCIRLLNSDIEELYCLLPVGTPVEIDP